MDKKEYKWSVGEVANLTREVRPVRNLSMNAYGHYIGSRYICVREASEGQPGILMKVLGKVPGEALKVVDGEPFCHDERDDLFDKTRYLSYRFPALEDLKEAVDIIRNNPELVFAFEKASMHVNPRSTFWVREMVSKFHLLKKPQVYNAFRGELNVSSGHGIHYRVSIVKFSEKELTW